VTRSLLLVAAALALAPPALGAARRVLLVDTSPGTTDARARREVVEGLASSVESSGDFEVQHAAPPGVATAGLQVDEILARVKSHSEKFEEERALALLEQAERSFRAASAQGATVSVEPLVGLLLARARLLADLGRGVELAAVLGRLATLAPTLVLDPGLFPPHLVQTFRRLQVAGRGRLGQLSVRSVPPGRALWVDGRRRGVTPHSLSLPAGEHFVTVGVPGAGRGRAVIVTVERRLEVTISVEGPRLTDNRLRNIGRRAGASHVVAVEVVASGGYQIRLRVLETRSLEPQRTLGSALVGRDRLTWATGQLAVQLQSLLGISPNGELTAGEPTPPAMVSKPSVLRSWWFWTIVGVVVGGGVATAVALTYERDPGVRVTLAR